MLGKCVSVVVYPFFRKGGADGSGNEGNWFHGLPDIKFILRFIAEGLSFYVWESQKKVLLEKYNFMYRKNTFYSFELDNYLKSKKSKRIYFNYFK